MKAEPHERSDPADVDGMGMMQGTEDKHVELASEQLYFDAAREHRERRREGLDRLPDAGIHKGAAEGLRHIADETKKNMRGPEEAVAFGRVDYAGDDDFADTFYIGHHAIWSEDTNDVLVINWRTETASPFYAATHTDTQGLARKRSYVSQGNTIIDFDDVVFAELAARVAELGRAEPEPDDHLLNELARNRTGEMQEIVETIQAAQYEIVRAPFDQLLVVQGGPGTGKTAVALHRVSWLLYNQSGIGAQDVLVVGPNPTFVRYIRSVLPALGDRDVRHADIVALSSVQVRLERHEDRAVAQLKGDRRMAGLLDRALQQRIRVPADGLAFGAGRSKKLSAEELTSIVDRLRTRLYAAGRVGLRERLRSLAGTETSETVESVLDRIWPNLTAAQFLQELLGSQNRLLEAAGDEFSAREVQTLYRQGAQRVTDEIWSSADAALLDHAHARISDDAGDRFGHIVVDEAQDLSPMQIAMIARRSSNGSMTILGDIAQSTGPWARDDWTDVVASLGRDGVMANVEELEVGYRVPRPAFDLAVRVLGDAAPGVRMPRVVREGPEPELVEVAEPDQLGTAVVSAARSFAGDGHLVGVICPEAVRDPIIDAFHASNVRIAEALRDGLGAAITLVSPAEAKGLEFDAVVVAEPAVIASEDAQGRRQLFIALTRTTGHLAVVHAQPFVEDEGDGLNDSLPDAVAGVEEWPSTSPTTDHPTPDNGSHSPPRADAATKAIARHFVDEIRGVVREDQIEAVLQAIRDELDAN